MELKGAFSTEHSIKIILPGPSILAQIRRIKFHLVDQEMGETFLRRPFLDTIGFNLQ